MSRDRIETYKELQAQLKTHAEDKYREFGKKLTPSKRPFMGVKIPMIREVVSLIPREKYEKFLGFKPVAIEEVMARGMIICKLPYEEMLKWFDSQISYIDDWSTCDVFCAGLRKVILKKRPEFLKKKVEKLLNSKAEFDVRVGLVILKSSYVEDGYLSMIFDWTEKLRGRNEYYVKMAIAWLLSECFIKFPAATTGYLVESKLPKWTFNKTISKICDSYRVDIETKSFLKKMRKV